MIRGRESEPEGDQCFNFTPYIRQGEYDREEVISEGYDPDHSPFGTPVYWRIVNRGDQQFYCGEIRPGFECVTDTEIFHVPAHWPDGSAKAAACAALRDSFHRRGVNRYLFAGECWIGTTPGLRPADDPDCGESVQVLAVERNGLRRYAFAEITRN